MDTREEQLTMVLAELKRLAEQKKRSHPGTEADEAVSEALISVMENMALAKSVAEVFRRCFKRLVSQRLRSQFYTESHHAARRKPQVALRVY